MENVVIYSRVSTKDQNCENQVELLTKIINQNGWNLIDTYVDEGISGSKGRESRKEFDRLNKDMIRRIFIIFYKIYKLSVNISDKYLVE